MHPEAGHEAMPNAPAPVGVTTTHVAETDAALARRAAGGDAAAFGGLYDRYFPRVYRYALARSRDRDEAEDVTSETFIRALGALHRYEPRTAFLAWLFRIARNAAIDRTRRRGRETPALQEARARPASAGDPERESLARERDRELRAALASLTEVQREVVTLRFFGGLSTEEICAVTGKGPSTVRGIQHRALLALRHLVPPESPA